VNVQVTEDTMPRPRSYPWPYAAWALPFLLLYVEWSWWDVFVGELETNPTGIPMPIPAAAALAVCGKLLAHATEAAFYVLLWRARGARLPFWRFLSYVVAVSLADVFSFNLAQPFQNGGAPAWRVWLAGLHLASGTPFHDSPALRNAFGSIGLLTATRIAMTGITQAKGSGRSRFEALAWTVGVWLVTRIAVWWAFDLIRGMSPLGGG